MTASNGMQDGSSNSSTSASKDKIVIMLHRYDLRLHDQAPYDLAMKEDNDCTHILPLYVFDERQIELSGLPDFQREGAEARTRVCGFWRTGPHKARFLLESVYDLKDRLKRQYKSDLIVRFGMPEKVVSNFIKAFQDQGKTVKAVYAQKEFCVEELQSEQRLGKQLEKLGVEYQLFDRNPLVHVEDLPFPIASIPDVYTPFRKRVEGLNDKLARSVIPTPEKLKPVPQLPDEIGYGAHLDGTPAQEMLKYFLKPLESSLQFKTDRQSKRSAFPFKGGETAALDRLEWYFTVKGGDPPPASSYKSTRNRLLGHEYSTKFSPSLALGTISPRLIMQKLREHDEKFGGSKDSYWIQFELLWRDYFLYITRKFGSSLFTLGGFEEQLDPKKAAQKADEWGEWNPDDKKIKAWLTGTTGVPFIDANMNELIQSGYMSNRGRQNVASFLTKDLYYDWRIGAEYFESQLIDFEPCANYGNWQYHAGVGNDPRASRQFNPIKQGKDYDVHGAFIKHWIPALNKVPSSRVHTPWLLTEDEKAKFDLADDKYPSQPIIEQQSWKSHYERNGQRSKANGNKNEDRKGSQRSGPQKDAKGGKKPQHGGSAK